MYLYRRLDEVVRLAEQYRLSAEALRVSIAFLTYIFICNLRKTARVC